MFYWRANICSPICIKMNNLIYQGDTLSRYAASTASTWIWAPALFVSSSVAYYYGLAGLAIFLIPNILCLILFGIISSYIINNEMANVSFLQLIDRCSTRQKKPSLSNWIYCHSVQHNCSISGDEYHCQYMV